MQNRPAVVDRAFLPEASQKLAKKLECYIYSEIHLTVVNNKNSEKECHQCSAPLTRQYARNVCAGCFSPQPISQSEDYFTALGVERRFHQDLALLEKRYFEISRKLHPDRFTTADSETRHLSLERMSLVNDAYRTLKDPAIRRRYLLAQEGVQISTTQPPSALAEAWFDIQDLLTENAGEARKKLEVFKEELGKQQAANMHHLEELETSIDDYWSRGEPQERINSLFTEMAKALQMENYFSSLQKQIVSVA